jgi:hypothetical protein
MRAGVEDRPEVKALRLSKETLAGFRQNLIGEGSIVP